MASRRYGRILLLSAALVVALARSAAATGYYGEIPPEVVIRPELENGPGGSLQWALYVYNERAVPLGAVSILVEGATGFQFDTTLSSLSVLDSVYSVRPVDGADWDALVINNVVAQTLVPTGARTRLGYFLVGDDPYLLEGQTPAPGDLGPAFEASIWTVDGRPLPSLPPYYVCLSEPCSIAPREVTVNIGVPESEGLALAAALAALAHGLGGKIRRRSGSVAAPT